MIKRRDNRELYAQRRANRKIYILQIIYTVIEDTKKVSSKRRGDRKKWKNQKKKF